MKKVSSLIRSRTGVLSAAACALIVLAAPAAISAQGLTYSTGAVAEYKTRCGGSDLPRTIGQAGKVRFWFTLGGLTRVSSWENGDVWGSDFRDGTGNANDMESQGGSDRAHIYYFTGHGTCQDSPTATSGDFIVTCGNFGTPDSTRIGTSSRWGNSQGVSRFMFVDASCPMDLVSLSNQWFPVFQGLHMAVGHSGDRAHDTLDSSSRGNAFAAYNIGLSVPGFGDLIPRLPVGDAWMIDGLTDVQDGVCAVAIAAGNDRSDAIDRREHDPSHGGSLAPSPAKSRPRLATTSLDPNRQHDREPSAR